MTKQIDVLEYHERAKVVRRGMRLLQEVYEFGLKSPNEYYRNLLVLSFQFTEMGVVEDALKILDSIPPEYFRNTLPAQMEDDPFLTSIARRTAEALVIENHVKKPTYTSSTLIQPGGLA